MDRPDIGSKVKDDLLPSRPSPLHLAIDHRNEKVPMSPEKRPPMVEPITPPDGEALVNVLSPLVILIQGRLGIPRVARLDIQPPHAGRSPLRVGKGVLRSSPQGIASDQKTRKPTGFKSVGYPLRSLHRG